MVRRAPAAAAQLARGGAGAVRHLRVRTLHQQVRQRDRRASQPRRKARELARGHRDGRQGEEQGGREHRRPEAGV